MSKIDEIKRCLEENTEEWAKTANQVITESELLSQNEDRFATEESSRPE